jgi:hypothetical protein
MLSMASCAPTAESTTPWATQTVVMMATTAVPTETATVTVTATSTLTLVRPTSTPVPPTLTATPTVELPTATITPLPTATRTEEEEQAMLVELIQTNGGCELPCWWGIIPGNSPLETVKGELAERGFWVEGVWAGIGTANDFGVFLEFEVEGNIIQSIGAGGGYLTGTEEESAYSQAFAQGWQPYEIDAVLSRYGSPTRVFIYHPFQADPGSGTPFHLILFYEALGFVIEYGGLGEQVSGGHLRVCPYLSDIFRIELFLYQPGRIDNIVETILPPSSISYIADPETVYELISWQTATGSSLESFYETYSQATVESCFTFLMQ